MRPAVKLLFALFAFMLTATISAQQQINSTTLSKHRALSASACSLTEAVLHHVATVSMKQSSPVTQQCTQQHQLQAHITHLPVPSAPPAWQQFCSDVEARGTAGIAEWMQQDTCPLPDIEGSAGKVQGTW